MPHLVSLVIKKIRPDAKGELTYDFSGIRLAGIKALLYRPSRCWPTLVKIPTGAAILTFMTRSTRGFSSMPTVCACTLTSADEAVASIAAFALALTKLDGAYSALEAKFVNPGNTPDFSWALTDALLELGDPALATLVSVNLDREDLQREVAYLIGKLGTARSDSAECKFLNGLTPETSFCAAAVCSH